MKSENVIMTVIGWWRTLKKKKFNIRDKHKFKEERTRRLKKETTDLKINAIYYTWCSCKK